MYSKLATNRRDFVKMARAKISPGDKVKFKEVFYLFKERGVEPEKEYTVKSTEAHEFFYHSQNCTCVLDFEEYDPSCLRCAQQLVTLEEFPAMRSFGSAWLDIPISYDPP